MASLKETFLQNNKYRSNELFRKRFKYNAYSRKRSKNHTHFINFQMGEKMFYGRMTPLYGIPVSLVDQTLLAPVKGSSARSGEQVLAFDFVALQFERMRMEVTKRRLCGALPNDRYISQMSAQKGFTNPLLQYDSYKQAFFAQIAKNFQKRGLQFTNIREFLALLEEYLPPRVREVPFTYPSFIKSRFCDVMSTGLAIEIADLKYSNDEDKVKHFIRSPNWHFYLNLCNKYGFAVDQHYPWRIVADLESSAMKRVAKARNVFYGRNMLYINYETASKTYMKMFLFDMLELYNLCYRRFVYIEEECSGGVVKRRKEAIKYSQPRDLMRELTFRDAIKFYMTLRIAETKPEMLDVEKDVLIRDALRLYDEGGAVMPLYIFEAIVSSTVDSMGSIVYYREQMRRYIESANAEKPLREFEKVSEASQRAYIGPSGAPVYVEADGGQAESLTDADSVSTAFGSFGARNGVSAGTLAGGGGGY